jgi:hypothetical protein
MILGNVPGLAEPEFAQGGEDAALLGDGVREYDIERADTIGGNEEQRISQIEDLAHLAALELLDAWEIDLRHCVRHGARLNFTYCMNPSRKFKENVLVVGFFLLSVAVVVIFVVGAWKGRTSARPSVPAAEQVNH